MRKAFVLGILLLGACSSQTALKTDKKTGPRDLVLITAFEPFGKWKVNLSTEVAMEIQRHGKGISALADVHLCILPVEYDRAAEKAIECYKKLPGQPRLVLSMGEGDCSIRVETGVSNFDSTPGYPDNAGVTRVGSPILPHSSARIGLTIPVADMVCSTPDWATKKVNVSISAGNYVCNNTAFRLAHFFRGKQISYGFIHVPHSGCDARIKDIGENGLIITSLLHTALTRHGRELPPLPSTREEAMTYVGALRQQNDNACFQKVGAELLNRYAHAPKIF